MSIAEHYAIVIGINDYALDAMDLAGPVNDAQDFYQWLIAPNGANIAPEKVSCILSTDFMGERAHPTPDEIEVMFEPFIIGGTQGRYGKRLYIFAAGHGFGDPHDMRSTAIYAANAQKQFPWHVAVTHYAEWLRRHAVFDDIILIMDCCRTINSLHAIREPQYPVTRGHPAADRVHYFYGFAVGRNQIARERQFEDGKYHGIFTQAVLHALKTMPPIAGQITGQALKNQIHNIIDGLAGDVSVDPPEIQLDSHRDVVFLTRKSADADPIQVTLEPHSGQEILVVLNGAYQEIFRQPATAPTMTITLTPGLYKILVDNTQRQTLFEVPNNEHITL